MTFNSADIIDTVSYSLSPIPILREERTAPLTTFSFISDPSIKIEK
jgi:hypothetical protein